MSQLKSAHKLKSEGVACLGIIIALLLTAFSLSQCAHGPRPDGMAAGMTGRPLLKDILADLRSNESKIAGFSARGVVTVSSPELTGIERFRQSRISFRKPSELSVVGRKRIGPVAFRLTWVGNAYLIEFPTEEAYYSNLEDEEFPPVPFSIPETDLGREMFISDSWSKLRAGDLRIVETQDGTTVLEIRDKRRKTRRVSVSGSPWRVCRVETYDNDGAAFSLLELKEYRDHDGILFPSTIDAFFEQEKTRLTFALSKITMNPKLDDADFDIHAQAKALAQSVSSAD